MLTKTFGTTVYGLKHPSVGFSDWQVIQIQYCVLSCYYYSWSSIGAWDCPNFFSKLNCMIYYKSVLYEQWIIWFTQYVDFMSLKKKLH